MLNVQAKVSSVTVGSNLAAQAFRASTLVGAGRAGSRDSFRAELREHQRRVGEMARIFAACAGYPAHQAATIGQAAALYDIGKLFMRGSIFQGGGRLSPAEEVEAQTHTIRGHWALKRGNDPVSKLAARIALEHHEHWDGSGYPNGLSGVEIGREARLVTICDAYVTLRQPRPYRAALSHEQAMSLMVVGDDKIRPTFFDPSLLAIFLIHGEQFRKWWDAGAASAAH
jgi:HD-GYP domain-containing protein (c-di-GMP phosphodiesterase class II)